MTNIEKIKDTLAIQYALELFLELYNEADAESERLYILYQCIDYISTCGYSIDKIKQYINLQYEKFEPFADLILSIDSNKATTTNSKKSLQFKNPVKVEVYTFSE